MKSTTETRDSVATSSVCRPLNSISELLEWTPSEACHSPLKKRKASRALFQPSGEGVQDAEKAPRLLVCHDMRGGYQEDRFYDGCGDPAAYSFYRWSAVDEFVYFSHRLVTIPPCGWVDAAHINGVPIYGTLITEGGSGHDACLQLLASERVVDAAVAKLVAISEHHGLDGWLVDIQNRLNHSQVNVLHHFLKQLTGAMHAAVSHSRVIWYDSVTRDGRLAFQNRLSEENEEFFGLCDGIFLNYWWTPESLLSSKVRAGSRVRDVYVGADVFGRGTRDGGGFCVVQPVAESRWLGLSTALFAPGWTHEVAAERCTLAEDVFWSRLTPLVGIRGPTSLPIETNFCQGLGLRRYADGRVTADSAAWHQLSSQQLQPSGLQRAAPADRPLTDAHGRPAETRFRLAVPTALGLPEHDAQSETMLGRVTEQRRIELACHAGLEPSQPGWEVYHTTEDGFSGGGCLAVRNDSGKAAVFRLFACDINLGPEEVELSITYSVKATSRVLENTAICLNLQESNYPGISRRILDPPVAMAINTALMDSCERLLVSMPVDRGLRAADTEWQDRRYSVPLCGEGRTCRLVSIGVYLPAASSALLGRLLLRRDSATEGRQ